jgi:fructoselysine 6-kinase
MKKVLTLARFCVDVFVSNSENRILAGGNALNVAANCANTGKADVFLMGNIGTDEYGDKIVQMADKYRLNHERLYRVSTSGGATASNQIRIADDGERVFVPNAWNDGVLRDFRISHGDADFIRGMDAVATTVKDYFLEELLEIRRKSPSLLLAADFMDEKQCPFSENWRGYCDSLDLFFISGKHEQMPLLKQWSRDFPQVVFILTLGMNGSVAFKNGEQYICEAVKVSKVVDTTGCGDSYQGAFIVDYLHNGDVRSAMTAGAKSAAATLGFVGAV